MRGTNRARPALAAMQATVAAPSGSDPTIPQIALIVRAISDRNTGVIRWCLALLMENEIKAGSEVVPLLVNEMVNHFQHRPIGRLWPPARLIGGHDAREGGDRCRVFR